MHRHGYKVAYRDGITSILNYVALEMETSTLPFFINFLSALEKGVKSQTS
jgi:hypothetical protein